MQFMISDKERKEVSGIVDDILRGYVLFGNVFESWIFRHLVTARKCEKGPISLEISLFSVVLLM